MEYYIRIETWEDIEKFKYFNHELKSKIIGLFNGIERDFRVEIFNDIINIMYGHNRIYQNGDSYYETDDFASRNNGNKCTRYKPIVNKVYSTLTSL